MRIMIDSDEKGTNVEGVLGVTVGRGGTGAESRVSSLRNDLRDAPRGRPLGAGAATLRGCVG
jgi:hypothetical protein